MDELRNDILKNKDNLSIDYINEKYGCNKEFEKILDIYNEYINNKNKLDKILLSFNNLIKSDNYKETLSVVKKKIVPVLLSLIDSNYTKNIFINRILDIKDDNIIVEELHNRLKILYKYFGNNFFIQNNVKLITITEYNEMSMTNKVEYYMYIIDRMNNIILYVCELCRLVIKLDKKLMKKLHTKSSSSKSTHNT